MTPTESLGATLARLFGVTLTPNPLTHIGDICPDAPLWLDHETAWIAPDGALVCVTIEQYHGYGLSESYTYCREHGLHFAAIPGGRNNTQLILFWRENTPCLLTD